MKFKRIKFKNYRCFLDGEIDFSLPPGCPNERNIVLFSAENGGGKTQLMFAFQFALYGLTEEDFRGIQGQAATAYALNQNIYEALASGRIAHSADATVELSFTYEDNTFTVSRTHTFHRKPNGVSSAVERVVLYVQDRMGDTKTYTDPAIVRARINQTIPEKTLYALLCDGERVRQLSSAGTETDSAIQAVVQRMTEHALLDTACQGIEKVKRMIQRQVSKRVGNSKDKVDIAAIERLESLVKDRESKIAICNNNIAKMKERISTISTELKEIAAVRDKEKSRELYIKNRKDYEKDLEEAEKKFIETLNDQAYWSIGDSLCNCVSELLKDISVRFPGLQSEMVASVMKGDRCICGRPIDATVHRILDELRLHLPPINIDAELSAVLHQYGQDEFRKKRRREIGERIGAMDKTKSKINETQEIIDSISKEIEVSNIPDAVRLEEENKACTQRIIEETSNAAKWTEEIRRAKEELAILLQRLRDAVSHDENSGLLRQKLNLLEGAEQGIACIKSFREKNALAKINHYLAEAFSHLRSKSDSTRQIYITMFEDIHRLVVYHEPSVNHEMQALPHCGGNEDELFKFREEVILKHENGNSMGQLKMTALAFMKAILDYVKDVARTDRHLEDSAYPIVVDAPFGDIKRENFDNAVQYLHEFADQVILLLADERVPEGIEPHVAKVYTVKRTSSANCPYEYSEIRLESQEV